jgi:hypothetical protein
MAQLSTATYKYDYYSGSSIGIYIGAALLTTVVGLEFSHSQSKMPIYGYASSLYDGVADGHVIVEGRLFSNFIQSQQLNAYISKAAKTSFANTGKATDTLTRLPGDFETNINHFSDVTSLTSAQIDEQKESIWGAISEGRSLSDVNFPSTESETISIARPDQHLQGFDIVIKYGAPGGTNLYTNSTVRVIRDVHINGFGQSITVDGEPIIESYSFIARSVT